MSETKLNKTEIHSKVGAGALGGAVSILLVWGAGLAGLEIPAEVGVALGTVISFGFGYIAKSPTSE